MLSKVREALNQAVEEVVKEFDSSYEQTKRANESLKHNNRFLMKRIKEIIAESKERRAALQAEKDRCAALQEERDKFGHEIEALQAALKAAELVNTRPEIFSTFTCHLSDEAIKIAELNKEMEDLQKKNDELIEQLKNRAILNSVLARKYEKLQIALNSDIGEAFECELDGKPFEKGYYIRISKEAYELSKDNRIYAHVTLMKHSDK